MTQNEFSTLQVAQMLGVVRRTVILWIEDDRLRAHKTPGGHRRILRRDLLSFLQNQSMPVPDALLPKEDRVLIIDHDQKALSKTARALQQYRNRHYHVQVARNGYEGLLKIGRFEPSVLLMDSIMPGMDGREILRCMREIAAFDHILTIVTAAAGDGEKATQLLACGAHSKLTKPFTIRKFHACLDETRPKD